MKRILTLSMVFCLLMALCLPCLASSVSASDVYIFERLPDVVLYGDGFSFDVVPFEGDYVFAYEGFVPEGQYELSFSSDGLICSTVVVYDLIYEAYPDSSDLCGPISSVDFNFYSDAGTLDASFSLSFFVAYFSDVDLTLAVVSSPTTNFVNAFDSLELIPLGSTSSLGLGALLNGDVLDDALLQVVYLIPVVLGVVVSIYGIRKAIAFVIGILRES